MTGARYNSYTPEFENHSWRKDGICQQPEYTAWDFADGFEQANAKEKINFLRKTCLACQVSEQCREYARNIRPVVGLYGGEYWREGRLVKNVTRVTYQEGVRDEKDRQKLSLTSAA